MLLSLYSLLLRLWRWLLLFCFVFFFVFFSLVSWIFGFVDFDSILLSVFLFLSHFCSLLLSFHCFIVIFALRFARFFLPILFAILPVIVILNDFCCPNPFEPEWLNFAFSFSLVSFSFNLSLHSFSPLFPLPLFQLSFYYYYCCCCKFSLFTL